MDPRRRPDTRGHAVAGAALVVALVVLGSTVVFALGNQAMADTERRSDVERAQQAMILLDSQTAQVTLGDADRRTVRFGRSSGSYHVDPGAGEIAIINVDRDGDGDDNDGDGDPATGGTDNDDEFILEPTALGAVVYQNGDRTIAYQGGGVWQKGPGDASRMVSPPEFHFRGGTPTLTIVQIGGSGGAGGSARATVSKGDFRAREIYPNATRSFADGDPFRNPVRNGSVIVRVESEYADAWGGYFEERTDGVVSYPTENVVTVELVSLAQIGEFDMPLEGGAIAVDGSSGKHVVGRTVPGGTAFSIRLRPDDADSAKFSNLQWSLYADEGDREFEMHLEKAGSGDGCSDGSTSAAAHLTVYYSWNGGEDYHGWRTTTPIEAKCANLDPSDPEQEIYLDVAFVDDDADGTYDDDEGASDVRLEFRSLSSQDLERFNPNGDLNGSYALDGHSAGWEPVDPTAGTTLSADQLVNHYFAELPDEFDLRVDDKGSDTTNEDASRIALYTSGDERHVTYLHVTTSRIAIEVDAD